MKFTRPLAFALLLAASASSPASMVSTKCDGPFLVFFDKDSSAVEESGMKIVELAAQIIEPCAPASLLVTGHIDGGEASTAPNLGIARANTIADALRKLLHSVPIATADAGSTDPLKPTKAGVSEPQNRFVVIEAL